MEGRPDESRHEWRFQIGEALPSESPLARFVVAVAAALNDNLLSNTLFVQAEKPVERVYFFSLASSHLYEAAESLRRADREWPEVRDFVAALDAERREEFARIAALADPDPPWPGRRLKEIRNSFFHYLRLDRPAADAGHLPLARGLAAAADEEGILLIEPGAPLSGIRALFADEVFVKTIADEWEEGETERLFGALANLQADLNRFAQGVLGRYLNNQPDGVVTYTEESAGAPTPEGD